MKVKVCKLYARYVFPNGREKVRCGYDGSIRNSCPLYGCPHYRPSVLQKCLNGLLKWLGDIHDRRSVSRP